MEERVSSIKEETQRFWQTEIDVRLQAQFKA